MSSTDEKYRLGFSYIPAIGPVRFKQIETFFPSLEAAWQADVASLKKCGLDDNAVRGLVQQRPAIDLDARLEQMRRLDISLLSWHDAGYPARLREIYDHPHVLFMRGEIKPEDELCLAVVGSRRPTLYGRQVAEEFCAGLAHNQITVVSGLARGIDTISHGAALASNGRTLAVLGGGLDSIYPAENSQLATRITASGALLSEYPPGVRPRPDHFPRRNRILAGLCLGVLVVEAGETSGALITAQLALEQNREVFAIPGSILSPASTGCNRLIQEGAKLVSRIGDILEELNMSAAACQPQIPGLDADNPVESLLLQQITAEPRHIDEICRAAGAPASIVSGALTMLEIKGLVKQVGAMNFALVRDSDRAYRTRVE
jgi:DNA processing protein